MTLNATKSNSENVNRAQTERSFKRSSRRNTRHLEATFSLALKLLKIVTLVGLDDCQAEDKSTTSAFEGSYVSISRNDSWWWNLCGAKVKCSLSSYLQFMSRCKMARTRPHCHRSWRVWGFPLVLRPD